MFGGNSNWRGPIWMPINFLIIEALRKFHTYYGDDFRIECPVRSGNYMSIQGVADIVRATAAYFPTRSKWTSGCIQWK